MQELGSRGRLGLWLTTKAVGHIWPFLRTQAHCCPGKRFWRESMAPSTPKQVWTSVTPQEQLFMDRTVSTCHSPCGSLLHPVFPGQGTASCGQSHRETRRGKEGRPPSRHCSFSCCLATRGSRSGSEKSPDHMCSTSFVEWDVSVEYLDLESGGQS